MFIVYRVSFSDSIRRDSPSLPVNVAEVANKIPSVPADVAELINQLTRQLVGEADYDKPVKIMVDKEDSQKNILKSGELSGIVLCKVLEEVVTQNAADSLEESNVDIVVREDFVDVRAGTADL
ncbi:MAG: hypothetical protein ACI30S_05060 [Muribaculaceae bacterium]